MKWYILHTMSGSEKKVKQMIEDQISRKNMQQYFEEILIPVVEVPEIKRGKQITSEKRFMPGYIFIKMLMTDDSWHLIKSVPKITGFLGAKTAPKALENKDIENILAGIEAESKNAGMSSLYSIGDKVQVIDGPFDSFSGVVESIDVAEKKLKISISIFGKYTPIELNFTQVKKP